MKKTPPSEPFEYHPTPKFVRELEPGIGQAVGERTVLRYSLAGQDLLEATQPMRINPGESFGDYHKWNAAALNGGFQVEISEDAPLRGRPPQIEFEKWGDVAERVAYGNASLAAPTDQEHERTILHHHIAKATVLMSGRHLQHGDEMQASRNMEVFTNCATAPTSFIMFYLLLNGSGVGGSYDDDFRLVDWDNAPNLRCVLDSTHPDYDYSAHESVRDATHKFGHGRDIVHFTVPDTREGWAKAVELYETMAFEKIHSRKLLVLDFSQVRPAGSPIKGMQNRPSSGPVPLINALNKVASIKGANLPRWVQAMYVDHYLAECVLVGGARRAARITTKIWTDKSVIDFVRIKRPIEYDGLDLDEVVEYRTSRPTPPESFLWSSNNSVLVDKQYWELLALKRGEDGYTSGLARHARKVHKTVTECAYGDGTGEPGFINIDQLENAPDTEATTADFFGSERYRVDDDTRLYLSKLAKVANNKLYNVSVNPCGEIVLRIVGGFCIVVDVVPYHANSFDEAEEAFRAATRAAIRINTMDSVYNKEVKRTNRIGVGMTGEHEFAWKFFGYGFRDLLDEDKSLDYWMTLARFGGAVKDEAEKYSAHLGLPTPETSLTIKPAGTTSKLFGLSEGWHLPAMRWYLRWVQFRNGDPLIEAYQSAGYKTRELVTYENTTIIGFPTVPVLASLGIGDKLVTAAEATPEEQYRWLQLGEKYYLRGWGDRKRGNQISYTLKYDPDKVDYKQFLEMINRYQPTIRCCSVMPQISEAAYEYQPEEPLTKAEYEGHMRDIRDTMAEDVDKVHVDCDSGACPINFEKEENTA